jgi:hypothetical protein
MTAFSPLHHPRPLSPRLADFPSLLARDVRLASSVSTTTVIIVLIVSLIIIGFVSWLVIRFCFRQVSSGEDGQTHRRRHRVRHPHRRKKEEGSYADIPPGGREEDRSTPRGNLVAFDEWEPAGDSVRPLDANAPEQPVPIDRPNGKV